MYMMYVGMLGECMKAEFPHLIKRGVPFEVPQMFEDLFKNDPLYVEVDEAEAKARIEDHKSAEDLELRLDIAQAAVDDYQEKVEAGHKAWKARDEAHHKKAAEAANKKTEEPEAPAKKIIPKGV